MELKFVIFFLTTDTININNVFLYHFNCQTVLFPSLIYVIRSKMFFFTEFKKLVQPHRQVMNVLCCPFVVTSWYYIICTSFMSIMQWLFHKPDEKANKWCSFCIFVITCIPGVDDNVLSMVISKKLFQLVYFFNYPF